MQSTVDIRTQEQGGWDYTPKVSVTALFSQQEGIDGSW